VQPARRRYEIAPRDEPLRSRDPLLRTPKIRCALAGAQQPTIDLADRDGPDHLAAGDGRHRLIDQRHPFGDSARDHVRVTQQRLRAELQVAVAELPSDREGHHRVSLALDRIVRPRRTVEREAPVLDRLRNAREQPLGPRHPTVCSRRVTVDRAVQEGEPTRLLGRLLRPAVAAIGRECALLELNRLRMSAPEVRSSAQPVERVRRLVQLDGLLEARTRQRPVGHSERIPPPAHESARTIRTHRAMIPDAAGAPRIPTTS
jgi:hypothetical protein